MNTTTPKREPIDLIAPANVAESHGGAEAEAEVAALTLDEGGRICNCNRAGAVLFKYRRSELATLHVSVLLPQLAQMVPITGGQPNPYLRFLSRIGHRFHAVTKDGERFDSQLFLNLVDKREHGFLSLMVRRVE